MAAPLIMLVAGEPSGDQLGARLVRALRKELAGEVRFVGVGGPAMAREGVASALDTGSLAVLGVLDALRVYPLVRRRAREVGELAARAQPDAAVLIDSWGFTLRAARAIRRRAPAVRLIKYVGPQVWATRPGRAGVLARTVDELLTIHAFDAPLFRRAGLRATFVGNPTLERDAAPADTEAARARAGWPTGARVLVVAPGSRRAEAQRLLGVFAETARRLAAPRPDLRCAVLAAEPVADEVAAANWPPGTWVCRGSAEHASARALAVAGLACSGTVTTELALAGVPVVVAYRLDPPTYLAARALIGTPFICLINVAAGRAVAPEFIQGDCAVGKLAAALAPLLDDPAARSAQSAAQAHAIEIMRGGVTDPAAAAARAVIASLAQPRASSGV